MNFDDAFSFIIPYEGGYVNDLNDPGGETKFGISRRAYPDLDISALTIGDAKIIYKRDYWDRLNLDSDQFPDRIKLALFDSSINCGITSAIKFLQNAVLETPDGIIGPNTLSRIEEMSRMNPNGMLSDILWWRFKKISQLPTFSEYGSGWVRRMMSVIANSA